MEIAVNPRPETIHKILYEIFSIEYHIEIYGIIMRIANNLSGDDQFNHSGSTEVPLFMA